MLPTTILVDDTPSCVVRPLDMKDLARFLRNGRQYLLAQHPDGRISHREASAAEAVKWHSARALHLAWGGDDEHFFGTPL
ncbi:MAG: hypothetical protein ACLP1D_00605 [Xanthobacteraceae bacterium]